MRVPLNTAPFSSRPTSVSGDISIRPTCIISGDNALAVGVLQNSALASRFDLRIRRQRPRAQLKYYETSQVVQLAYQETTRCRPILHIRGQRAGRDCLHPLSRRSRVVQLAYQETTRWLLYGDNE